MSERYTKMDLKIISKPTIKKINDDRSRSRLLLLSVGLAKVDFIRSYVVFGRTET